MSKPVTITFQASSELHAWLKSKAKEWEQPVGTFVRLICLRERGRDSRAAAPAAPIMETADAFPRRVLPITLNDPNQTIPEPQIIRQNPRIYTVREAKRRAKGKAVA